jgi:hypothetical protein
MKVGFLTNHISYGGTEVALYDYAHFNETLLGNTSIVLTRDYRQTHAEIYDKFTKRFPMRYIETQLDIDAIVGEEKLDVLYVIKSGEVDWFWTSKCKTIIHCVFTTKYPHGTVYCAISDTLNRLHHTNVPVLPHMISVESHGDSFRSELGIPPGSTVIGRYGSYDSFDIPFVHSSILDMVSKNPSLVFVFMNTKPFTSHPQIVFLPRTTDAYTKRKFINTCDAMLHARLRGETFGLSCGEFAVCGKPILTYALSPERAHLDILGNKALVYRDAKSLTTLIQSQAWKQVDMANNGYLDLCGNIINRSDSNTLTTCTLDTGRQRLVSLLVRGDPYCVRRE